jgi:DNA topoisomerase-1
MSALAIAPSVLGGRRSAKLAKLRYVTDDRPGIRRERRGRGVRYIGPAGSPVRNIDVLRRIKRLAIPPAWTAVWICADPHGHLQAVGRDARGRRQYRYHERWRQVRDEAKYERMLRFGRALPAIRRGVARHLALPGLPFEKVLATVVRLLETTLIRVGNEEYRKANHSFGLTTLRSGQVKVAGESLHLEFRGKGGKRHCVDVFDRRVAAIVRRCQDLPGHELFQYLGEDGRRHTIGSSDVNTYLQALAGEEFTAKDFRTWAGTVLAARALEPVERASPGAVNAAVKRVAEHLGNTPAICRKCYVHPAVIDAFLDGSLGRIAASIPRRASSVAGERMVMKLLERVKRSAAAS